MKIDAKSARPKLKKLLVTGASGGMATGIRPMLTEIAETVVVSGRREITNLLPHEESRVAPLDDAAALSLAMKDCDGVIHLGGYSIEGPFKPILDANISGVVNLYQAAQANGQPRIVFASSNHVVGFYQQSETIDSTAIPRPDSLYGASKVFGESIARLYFEKMGQETAILRLGSCFDKPTDHRMLATYMSYRDFVGFCGSVFQVETLGCPIVYGMSQNERSFWDNSAAEFLGWKPQDSADGYIAEVQAAIPNPDPNDPLHIYQGGAFAGLPIAPESEDD